MQPLLALRDSFVLNDGGQLPSESDLRSLILYAAVSAWDALMYVTVFTFLRLLPQSAAKD